MSEPIYERYKDALRRGHVAALRGRLEQAIDAYVEAAGIATERPLPHTSLGGVLVRLGRIDEALASYEAALERAPRDESALHGRAEALARANRPAEAADALDLVAEVQQTAGRLT
ncbi:MAG TPA: tetratricopeptide repeat protein, partial [Candidatus Limnocylindrales bacterium]